MGFSSQLAHRAMHHKNWSMTARIPSSLPIKSLKKQLNNNTFFLWFHPFSMPKHIYIYVWAYIYMYTDTYYIYIYTLYTFSRSRSVADDGPDLWLRSFAEAAHQWWTDRLGVLGSNEDERGSTGSPWDFVKIWFSGWAPPVVSWFINHEIIPIN